MKRERRSLASRVLALLAVLSAALAFGRPAWSLDEKELQKVIDGADARRDAMLKEQLANPYPPLKESPAWHYEDFALAAYYLNQRVDEANKALLAEREKVFPDVLKKGDFHWHAYILERIYFLFNSKSKFFPGRMSAEAEEALVDMLWQWAGPSCQLGMTLPGREWWAWGSENHHAQAWSSFWGAAHIFAERPDTTLRSSASLRSTSYRDRRYADGTTPAQMAKAFDEYYKRVARERASKGLLVEWNSGYNKYTLGGWYNMTDFAEDPVLRKRMKMLLDLFWASWATEQIDGVQGGSRHRCYPGRGAIAGPGGGDGMSWYHFGLGTAQSTHPSHMCAATSFYRPPLLVADLALDTQGRGVYASISRLPGLAQPRAAGEPARNFVTDPRDFFYEKDVKDGVYALAPEGGSLVRYTWCTPDFIMGTSMVEARPREDWTAISSQNRWEGVIFGGRPTARIFVQPLQPARGSVYNANWSVQNKGVLVVQRLKTTNAHDQLVWFDNSLKRVEKDGWVFAEAHQAYAGVRVVQGGTAWEADTKEQHREGKGPYDLGMWLKCEDEFSPVIIEAARKSDYKDFEAFQGAILANPLKWEKARLDYSSASYKTSLTLFADYSRPPMVDGTPMDYTPKKVYDSPFIQSDFGSGVIAIQKGGARRAMLDFQKP